jgi:carbon storage regulator CsrA
MYVLARHEGESILMLKGPDGYLVEIKVLSVNGKIARLGIDAPKEINIIRSEMAGHRNVE